MNEGWICPVCKTVHAPYIVKCDSCPPIKDCEHEWIAVYPQIAGGPDMQCRKCGELYYNYRDYLEL